VATITTRENKEICDPYVDAYVGAGLSPALFHDHRNFKPAVCWTAKLFMKRSAGRGALDRIFSTGSLVYTEVSFMTRKSP
jgi:hypothetical protein